MEIERHCALQRIEIIINFIWLRTQATQDRHAFFILQSVENCYHYATEQSYRVKSELKMTPCHYLHIIFHDVIFHAVQQLPLSYGDTLLMTRTLRLRY